MLQRVLMPKLGQTMEEATIQRWLKQEGDEVKKGEVLLEITTDKATLEVESFVQGTLRKILAQEGETLPVNSVIALVGDPADELPADLESLKVPPVSERRDGGEKQAPRRTGAEGATEGALPPTATPALALSVPLAERLIASPRARRRARSEHVNLRLLTGSGPGGRIVEMDVLAYAERARSVRATPMARRLACERGVDITRLRTEGRIRKEDVLAARPDVREVRREKLSAMRRIIAERMTYSKQQIPHFYLNMDVDMGEAMALRKRLNAESAVRVGFHDMLVRASAMAFVDHPRMNGQFAGDAVVYRSEIYIGLAVALDDGLIVPVVRSADRLGLREIARESARLIEAARGKRLTPDEFEGGCFTISNLGMYGVDSFCAVINPGEAAILGLGRIAERVVARDGWMQVRPMMTMTLSGDHRAIDGTLAAQFMARIKELLENPDELLE